MKHLQRDFRRRVSAQLRWFALSGAAVAVQSCGAHGEREDVEVAELAPQEVAEAREALTRLPDLAPLNITRDSYYFYVKYCNTGTSSSNSKFLIKLTNTATNQSFTSNSYYPYTVPAPGTCATTGGFTCGLIGDPNCSQCISVKATVDSSNVVKESRESNNGMTNVIGCLDQDLTVRSITRDATYYYVTFCNTGTATSSAKILVKLTNTATNQSFTSNSNYPYSIPAPGTCVTTGGFTCGLIGDTACNECMSVQATVDSENTAPERNESNNTATQTFGCNLPDLVATSITRSSTYYYVTFCNQGSASSDATFVVTTTNDTTGQSFTSNPYYPYSVPAPGTCVTTGGLTCGLIGDPQCNLKGAVSAVVDSANTLVESSELNNGFTVSF